MKVVITGSTMGIGKAMAYEFLKHWDNVVISSRNQGRVVSVVDEPHGKYPDQKVMGTICDVGTPDDVEALGKYALDQRSSIDMWIIHARALREDVTNSI